MCVRLYVFMYVSKVNPAISLCNVIYLSIFFLYIHTYVCVCVCVCSCVRVRRVNQLSHCVSLSIYPTISLSIIFFITCVCVCVCVCVCMCVCMCAFVCPGLFVRLYESICEPMLIKGIVYIEAIRAFLL